ncbi:c-type cytochrome [Caenispirillum salinarum]|uniref:c-type cytochrome n=1 Tax=Caenispirillum salinarum TaxID=859058 RepID=UPI00384D0133
MSMHDRGNTRLLLASAALALVLAAPSHAMQEQAEKAPEAVAPDAGTPAGPTEVSFGFGQPAPDDLIAQWAIAIPPDGEHLPDGSGSVEQGREVFNTACAACHGEDLQGVAGTGGVALIGGRGTLGTDAPKKTVESYWPYATTLFDYVRRAMPFTDPGSLTDEEVYAVSAYILNRGEIIPADATMDADTLPRVEMPNRDGFYPDPRPDVQDYR